MTYKFYKAQVTGGGYMPAGHCQAALTLDVNRTPSWTEVSEEFERVCMPCFEATMRIGPMDKFEPLKPYSEEAMEHLSKRQLPGLGFMMVTVKDPASATAKGPPPSFGFQAGMYSPPPGLFASPPKPGPSAPEEH